MKIAVISDIHSNPVAFHNCYMDAKKKGCERFICLGDIVGYGYDPNCCIKMCRDLGIECLLGNHDAGLVGMLSLEWFSPVAKDGILRQRTLISEGEKNWLRDLNYTKIIRGEDGFVAAFAHGTLGNPSDYDYISYHSDAVIEFPTLKGRNVRVLFVGHTHEAKSYLLDADGNVDINFINISDEEPIRLANYDAAIINVGSCGYPRVQPYSIYCIYDDEEQTATHRILPFPFLDYEERMQKAGIQVPLWLETQHQIAEGNPVQWR